MIAVVLGLQILVQMAQFYCLPDSFGPVTFMVLPILGYSVALYFLPKFESIPRIGRAVVSSLLSIPFWFFGSIICFLIIARNGGYDR